MLPALFGIGYSGWSCIQISAFVYKEIKIFESLWLWWKDSSECGQWYEGISIILETLNWSLQLSSESSSRSAILTVAEKEEFVSLLGHSLNIRASAAGLANVSRLLFTLSWETMSAICL